TFATAYGLAGEGGNATWMDAPVLLSPIENSFAATLWVNNTTGAPFTGGTSTITLPGGLQLKSGETPTKQIGDILPGTVKQLNWQIAIPGGAGTSPYSVKTTFTSGSPPLTANKQVVVAEIKYVYLPLVQK